MGNSVWQPADAVEGLTLNDLTTDSIADKQLEQRLRRWRPRLLGLLVIILFMTLLYYIFTIDDNTRWA